METDKNDPPPPSVRPLDRSRLRDDLRSLSKVMGTTGTEKLLKFLDDNELKMPFPPLLVRQVVRHILQSKADKLCDLPEPDVRNVLRVFVWECQAALGELPPDQAKIRPHHHPAIRRSLELVMSTMLEKEAGLDQYDEAGQSASLEKIES